MKVTCNRAALCDATQLAASIVPSRTTKPILTCAKIDAPADGNTLTIVATDGEITIRYVVPQVEIADPGTAVVPADRITAILRETADDTVAFEMTDATFQLSAKDSKYHIYCHDPDDFPEVAPVSREGGLGIQAQALHSMIARTSFVAARESTRYAINGVLWEQKGKKMRLVATDGRRLAKVEGTVTPADKDQEQTGIVPLKLMGILDRVLADPEEKVGIAFSDNQVAVWTPRVEVSGSLVHGRFPKYDDVIPASSNKKGQVDAQALQSAVRRAALLTNEQSKGIQLAFSADKLRLSANAPEAGDAEINMEVKYEGDDLEIGFNPQFLLDMLKVAETDQIVFELTESGKPGLLRAGSNFLYVVMPVTV